MNEGSRIYVAGHAGLVGSALVRRLRGLGRERLIVRSHAELDLCHQREVEEFFAGERPEYVLLAAARVGGIHANHTYPADFIRENLQIQTNVIDAAWRHGARKLLFLGSSCIYPRLAPQPITESCLLTGELEPTNEAYAIAKIAGLKMCQAYRRQYGFNAIAVMPTNLYGPHDNFDLETAHVLPALIRKFHEGKVRAEPKVLVWGSGAPRREFLHVDDMADACISLMERYEDETPINIGAGADVSIRELAFLVRDIVGYVGDVQFDASRPNGTPRKLLDVTRMRALGWEPRITLRDGIAATYRWFTEHCGSDFSRTSSSG